MNYSSDELSIDLLNAVHGGQGAGDGKGNHDGTGPHTGNGDGLGWLRNAINTVGSILNAIF